MKRNIFILFGLAAILVGCGNSNKTIINDTSKNVVISEAEENIPIVQTTTENSNEIIKVEFPHFYNKGAMEQYETSFDIYGDVTVEIGSDDGKKLCLWIMKDDYCAEQLYIDKIRFDQKFTKPIAISFEDINHDNYNDILIICEFENLDGSLFNFGGIYYQLPKTKQFINDSLFHKYLANNYYDNKNFISTINDIKKIYT